MNDENSEPKIVVDDDWKSQVEKEKEQLRQQMEESQPAEQEMPPASMPILITTLATQALSALGQIPDPVEGKPVLRKPIARHFIDTLAMLEEKTSGNLTEEESGLLGDTLHQLRMVFVQTPDSVPTAEPEKPGPTIELP